MLDSLERLNMTKTTARENIKACHALMSETNSPTIRAIYARMAQRYRAMLPILA